MGNNNPPDGVALGGIWAYRERRGAPLVEVEVLQIGSSRPRKVKIRHFDDRYEGKVEWIPGARLKVPWAEVGTFLADEARWDRLTRRVPTAGEPLDDVAWQVFDQFFPGNEVTIHDRGGGVAVITDVLAVSTRSGVPEGEIRHPDSFVDEHGLNVPWVVTQRIAEQMVQREGGGWLLEERRKMVALRAVWTDELEEYNIQNFWSPLDIEEELARNEGRVRGYLLDHLERWAGEPLRDDVARIAEIADALARSLQLLRAAVDRLSKSKAAIDQRLVKQIRDHLEGIPRA